MSKPLTYQKPSGEWGIEGVDLTALPPKVYGALMKLRDIEHPACPTNADALRAAMTTAEMARILTQWCDSEHCRLDYDFEQCFRAWLDDLFEEVPHGPED